jgi:hypothetical protein
MFVLIFVMPIPVEFGFTGDLCGYICALFCGLYFWSAVCVVVLCCLSFN